MAKVLTYQTPSGDTLNITPDAVEIMTAADYWPRNGRGEFYCNVLKGLHYGYADIDAAEAKKRVLRAAAK